MTIEKHVEFLVTMDASELNRLLTNITCLCETEETVDGFKQACMNHAMKLIQQLQDAGYYENTPS